MRQSSKSFLFACLLAAAVTPALAKDSPKVSPDTALRIVLDTQQDKLRVIDSPDSWWHDAKERSWSVERPAEPGVLDTTHTFTVTYRIDGILVASWRVDTHAGTAIALP